MDISDSTHDKNEARDRLLTELESVGEGRVLTRKLEQLEEQSKMWREEAS